jgi:hypothetical protein
MPRPLLLLAALIGVAPLVTGAWVPARAASPVPTSGVAAEGTVLGSVDVTPDPDGDLYVGTGGLVERSSDWRGDDGSRQQAASCTDCRWRVSRVCSTVDSTGGLCNGRRLHCDVDHVPVGIWLSRAGEDWVLVGHACQGPEPPATVTDVARLVRERALAAVPPLRVGVQPADGTLVRLPALFRTGQPAEGISGADLSVLGLDVRLDARVRWRWTYGDGAGAWTRSPGGTWPDDSVAHAYLRAGAFTASVDAVWRAQFTVDGLGPFPVDGPDLAQHATVPVVVRPAHAHLVG